MKALDLLHREMRAVSHHRTATAIEIASDGGAFVRSPPPISIAVIVAKDHVMVHLN
jgi:hypothetical protein